MDYFATYNDSPDHDEATHNSIEALNDRHETETLDAICENCQALACSADLYDAAGFRKGWVQSDGRYKLN